MEGESWPTDGVGGAGGSVIGDEVEWQWFCYGSSSSLCRDTSLSLFFFSFSFSVFDCSSSCICLCFSLFVLFLSFVLQLFFSSLWFSLSSLFKMFPFCFLVFLFFFFKIFLSLQNSLLCFLFCLSLYLLLKSSSPLSFSLFVSLLSILYFVFALSPLNPQFIRPPSKTFPHSSLMFFCPYHISKISMYFGLKKNLPHPKPSPLFHLCLYLYL